MPGLGHNAYVGVAKEANWGEKVVTGMSFQAFLSESLNETFDEKVVQGIRGGNANGRVQTRRVRGNKTVAGDLQFEVDVEAAVGHLLKAVLPTEDASDFDPNPGGQHVFTPGLSLLPGLTVQVGRSAKEDGSFDTGTVFDYAGGRVSQLAFDAAVNEMLKATASLTFMDRSGGTSQSPSYTSENPLIYHTGTLKVDDDDEVVKVTSFKLTIATGMKADRRAIGSNVIMQQVPGMYEVTGEIVVYYDASAVATDGVVDKFLNNKAASIELDLTGPSLWTAGELRRLKIELPVVFLNGETPKVAGPSETMLTLPFRAIQDGSGTPNELIQVTLVNSRTSAY